MQKHSPLDLDEPTLDSLERYVVIGPDALRDPEIAQALAGQVEVAQRLRGVLMALRIWPRTGTEQSLNAAMRQIRLAGQRPMPRPVPDGKRVYVGSPRAPQQIGWFTVTAIVMVGVMVLALGWTAGVRHVTGRVARAASVYSTRNGERGDIMLPDGSRVALDVASRLEVPADYAAGNRTVRLTGEALFTVPHRAGTPFTVVAGAAKTSVLGTSFIVRHYTTDTTTTVAVQDGKVAVRTVVLTTGRQVVIGASGAMQVQPSRPSQFTFATGIMTLDNMPLADAIAALDRWYDVDIRVHDPILERQQIKGEFAVGSVADLANILELTFNVHLVRNGRVLTLYPQGR